MNITQFRDSFYEYSKNRQYKEALKLVESALETKIPPDQLITQGIAESLKKFQEFSDDGYTKVSAFQLLAIGKIAEDSIEKIKPHLTGQQLEKKDKIVIGTIKNDFHGLGLKILHLFLEREDFEVINLGVNVDPELFVEIVEKLDAKYLFISTMMLNNILGIKQVSEHLNQKGLAKKVKFFVGGAPFNYNYSYVKKVGADDTAEDIYELINKLKGITPKRRFSMRKIKRFFKREK